MTSAAASVDTHCPVRASARVVSDGALVFSATLQLVRQ